MKQKRAERLAAMFGVTLYPVRRPARHGWFWARQRPGDGRWGDSCGWRPVRVVRYSEWGSLDVTEYGDSERLQQPREVASWEWGPPLEPPEDAG